MLRRRLVGLTITAVLITAGMVSGRPGNPNEVPPTLKVRVGVTPTLAGR